MNEAKLCPNGHYYPASDSACPYCPRPGGAAAGATQSVGGSADKTQVFGGAAAGAGADKTQIFGGATGGDGKTQIWGGGSLGAAPIPGQSAPQSAPNAGRKLVGWLVTFDGNSNGRDYRLHEGRNTIGQGKDREVAIDFDPKVSSHHTTLLYRLGEFSIRDEMSTNGTFLNGVLANEGTVKDGDKIRVGDTTFLFRTAW